MISTFSSETRKLRTRTYAVGAAGMAAFMAVAMLISIGGAGDEPSDRGPAGLILTREDLAAADGLGRSLGNGVTLLGITALTIVAINVGSEYHDGTIRNLLIRQPHRVKLLLGKALALAVYVVAAVAVSSLAGIGAALVFAPGNEVDTSLWSTSEGVRATAAGVAGLTLAVGGWAAIGLLLGVALRSAPAAIGVGVAYSLPVEILLAEAVSEAAPWLPGQILQSLARGGAPWLGYSAAVWRTVGWVALTVGVATVLFSRRDVSE